jgi:hypothetical protein
LECLMRLGAIPTIHHVGGDMGVIPMSNLA